MAQVVSLRPHTAEARVATALFSFLLVRLLISAVLGSTTVGGIRL
jgi:hypothetical protein